MRAYRPQADSPKARRMAPKAAIAGLSEGTAYGAKGGIAGPHAYINLRGRLPVWLQIACKM